MLKRNGELCEHNVPGVHFRLTEREMDAYKEALGTIKAELDKLETVKQELGEVATNPGLFLIPQESVAGEIITIPSAAQWQVVSRLHKLSCSQILLCQSAQGGVTEFALVQQFKDDSPYGRSNGKANVVLTGNDPTLLLQDYVENTAHTLSFMASDLVAKAQKVVWERFAYSNPARVVKAISERCAQTASLEQGETQRIAESHAPKEAVGQRV